MWAWPKTRSNMWNVFVHFSDSDISRQNDIYILLCYFITWICTFVCIGAYRVLFVKNNYAIGFAGFNEYNRNFHTIIHTIELCFSQPSSVISNSLKDKNIG